MALAAPWAQDGSNATIRVTTRLVPVDVLVKDKRTGARVESLIAGQFRVSDDGRADRGEVRAHLVQHAGHQLHVDQRIRAAPRPHAELGDGGAAFHQPRHHEFPTRVYDIGP